MSLLGMVLGNAAVCLASHEILRRVRSGVPSTDAVLFLVLRLLLISAAVLVTGLLGVFNAAVLGGLSALVLAGLIARGALKRIDRPLLPDFGLPLSILAGAVLVRLLVQAWFFAPSFGDVVDYHLPKVAEWVVSGAIRGDVGVDLRGWFPAGFELIEAWWAVFLHHDVLIEGAGLEFLLLGGTAAYALARSLGADSRTSSLAAVLFGMTPGLQLQAVSCMNDGPVAALVVALMALIRGGADPRLLLVVVFLGTGIKPTFLFLMPGIAILFYALREHRRPTPPGRVALVGLPLLALGVGAFWYLRNWGMFGNPFYPMGTELGRTIQQVGPSWSSFASNLRNLLDSRIYDRERAPGASSLYVSNWGPAVFALGAPALLLRLRTDAPLRHLFWCSLASVSVVFFLVFPDPWSMRFILFFPVLPALALATWTRDHRFPAPIVAAVLILEAVSATVPDDVHSGTLRRMAAQSWPERTAFPGTPGLSEGETIGYLAGSPGSTYWLYGPGFDRKVAVLRETTLEAFRESLSRRSIRLFYAGNPGPAAARMLEEGAAKGWWVPFSDGFGLGYRVTGAFRDP